MVGNKAQGMPGFEPQYRAFGLMFPMSFVQGLAAQLAIALDRVYLADQERRRQKSNFNPQSCARPRKDALSI